MNSIKILDIFIGNKCNLSCLYCDTRSDVIKSKTYDPTIESIIEGIDLAKNKFHIDNYSILGGEALFYLDKLETIARHIRSFDQHTNILVPTNGRMIDKKLNEIKETNNQYNFIIKEEALWDKNGEQPFYISIDIWGDLGCTLDSSKREKLDLDNPRIVKTIRLSDFLDNFDDNDYIVLKLDIEGGEYRVISDLINTNKINKINELFVEWHDHFFNTSSQPLKVVLSKYNIKINHNWM